MPPQPTPALSAAREDAAAWQMVRTCEGQAAKGRCANQHLLIAETYGANDPRSRTLAYCYARALDAANMGGGGGAIPRQCELRTYPRHLSHLKSNKRPEALFTNTALHALEFTEAMPACVLPDGWWHLAHADFRQGGARFDVMEALLQKWEQLYADYIKELKARMPNTDEWTAEKSEVMHGLLEKYREKLIEGYSDDELEYPQPDSQLLAEAAAVYMVNHRNYGNKHQRRSDGDPSVSKGNLPSLKFSWLVAGDYFNLIRSRQLKASERPNARRGAVAVCDVRTTATLLAGSRAAGAGRGGRR
jgi:hypothetical protein